MKLGGDSRPMVKSWLAQLLKKLHEKAGESCREVDFAITLEVTGNDPSTWFITLKDGKVSTKPESEAKAFVFVDMNTLNQAARLPRLQPFEQAAQQSTFRVEGEPDAVAKLRAVYEALK